MASAMIDRLEPHARRGIPIVGCEPSCVLTLGDEYPALLPDDPRVGIVAGQVQPLSALISGAIDDGSLVLDGGAPSARRRIALHSHCHERALIGTKSTVELLSRIPGADVVELDSGCCGMAGSFGFEAEHYSLSMKIGALRLFPALEAEAADGREAAPLRLDEEASPVAGRRFTRA